MSDPGLTGGDGGEEETEENHGVPPSGAEAKFYRDLTKTLSDIRDATYHSSKTKPSPKLRPPPPYTPKIKFEIWWTQFELYLNANDIPREHWTASLLSLLAPECQEFFYNHRLHEKPFLTAVDRLKDRYGEPKHTDKFFIELTTIQQSNSESIQDFFERLVGLANSANLHRSDFEPLIKSRFCYGLCDKSVAEKLINLLHEQPHVSLEDLLDRARDTVRTRQLLKLNEQPKINNADCDEVQALKARIRELEKQNQSLQSKPQQSQIPTFNSHRNSNHFNSPTARPTQSKDPPGYAGRNLTVQKLSLQ